MDEIDRIPRNAGAEVQRLEKELAELQDSFDLRWKADMRAIARWRAVVTSRESEALIGVLPDHADLCVWLLGEVERLEEALRAISVRGTHGEGDFPMTTSELREIARDALARRPALGA